MSKTDTIPERHDVTIGDTWDLSKLFADDDAWEQGLKQFDSMLPNIESFKGTLGKSASALKTCLDFMNELGILEERLGYYAHLKTCEDGRNSSHQEKQARYMQTAVKSEALASYMTPEIQAIPDDTMRSLLESPVLADFRIYLRKILRFKPHVLSEKEEKLLALQMEANQTAKKAFSALTDVDFDFGLIDTPGGEQPLSHAMFSVHLQNQDREVRKSAYRAYYSRYEEHKHAIAALYTGSVHLDTYRARVRNYPSSRAAALFPDNVPEEVYDNLIRTVHDHLPHLQRYYSLRKRVLGIDPLNHYDVYVPLLKTVKVDYPYNKAVDLVIESLSPLGPEYCDLLKQGLKDRWVDKYENKGKRSGAFSAGSYAGDPYILLNYEGSVLRNVFTLAHEGGHSMHSLLSVRNNPFQHYQYTIFEAEVASTFNEQLLADHMLKTAASEDLKAYITGKLVDDIIATIYRQTMFAEFELLTHSQVEEGRPLTVDNLRSTYRTLLETYFRGEVELSDLSDLEGLRIPHFYNAFYVYKYATGLSAAVSLARQVLSGGAAERDRYCAFLKSGGSKYPLESLAAAGIDMSRPEPIREALNYFGELVDTLDNHFS